MATLVGGLGGQVIPDPRTLGLDLVFPAAMAGLAVALVTGRRELVAVAAGAAIAVGLGLAVDPRTGVVAGGLLGPLVALVAPFPERPSVLPQDPVEMGHPHLAEALEAGPPEGVER